MNSLDQQVLMQLSDWLKAGKQCWLCTIIKTFGSSPRPVGSLLACNEDGLYCGSLSGGCVEDDLRESINNRELATSRPEKIKYGVTVEDVQRLGLPCGGTLEVVIEPISPDQHPLYLSLAEKIASRELLTRIVNLDNGATSLEKAERFEPLVLEDNILRHTYGPSFQLLLIGAVQVAYYLANMATALDYQVEVCDPRQELVENSPIDNVPVINAMPDDWLRSKTLDQQTAVIALCHDPRIDDMALMEALQESEAFYIGAMGSERTSAQRRERLTLLDITAEQIEKLHAPVGLSIGSKTPPEIAIAILAELTSLRALSRNN
ncbi:MAG: xanthine dehydrogenase accessory factor [Pseudohongiellaceae bacterium]|jgi:xanthine dehydrogenase accessory factor|tara:strand:+ start:167 stop:1126 length:960 start_codon:yes stop_codon:yes gene_type:complete